MEIIINFILSFFKEIPESRKSQYQRETDDLLNRLDIRNFF